MEIAECDLFFGIRSTAFLSSPWVQFELETAKKLQKKIVLFDMLKDVSPLEYLEGAFGQQCHVYSAGPKFTDADLIMCQTKADIRYGVETWLKRAPCGPSTCL